MFVFFYRGRDPTKQKCFRPITVKMQPWGGKAVSDQGKPTLGKGNQRNLKFFQGEIPVFSLFPTHPVVLATLSSSLLLLFC